MGVNSEKYIEKRLKDLVKAKGGLCLKWVSPGFNGVPDRIVMMPNGQIYFVELKSTGQKPGKLQEWVHNQIRELGFKVFVIDSIEQLNQFVNAL